MSKSFVVKGKKHDDRPTFRHAAGAARSSWPRAARRGGAGGQLRSVSRAGSLLFVSGQLPLGPEGSTRRTRASSARSVSLEAGQAAARVAALNVLAQANAAVGDLARLRAVRLGGYVNCAPDFAQLPQVVNGASDLVAAVLGENGKHARFAVGVAQLPLDAAVEVEAIFEILG